MGDRIPEPVAPFRPTPRAGIESRLTQHDDGKLGFIRSPAPAIANPNVVIPKPYLLRDENGVSCCCPLEECTCTDAPEPEQRCASTGKKEYHCCYRVAKDVPRDCGCVCGVPVSWYFYFGSLQLDTGGNVIHDYEIELIQRELTATDEWDDVLIECLAVYYDTPYGDNNVSVLLPIIANITDRVNDCQETINSILRVEVGPRKITNGFGVIKYLWNSIVYPNMQPGFTKIDEGGCFSTFYRHHLFFPRWCFDVNHRACEASTELPWCKDGSLHGIDLREGSDTCLAMNQSYDFHCKSKYGGEIWAQYIGSVNLRFHCEKCKKSQTECGCP